MKRPLRSIVEYLALAVLFAAPLDGAAALTMVAAPASTPKAEAAPAIRVPRKSAAPASPSPIPEPGIWALVVAGFGIVGLAVRRRSPTPVVVS